MRLPIAPWIVVAATSLPLFPLSLPAQSPTATPPLKLATMDRVAEPVVAPASDQPTKAIQRFKLPPDFNISLFAAEPLLANPVAFAFDEKGTLYVSETYRYRSSVLDIRDYMPMLEQDLASRNIDDRLKLIMDQFGPAGKSELSIESDIVRRVVDRDGDGVADTSSVFANGFNNPLDGIASGVLARDGKVWFTNIPHLWRLDGPDAQGKSTGRTSLSEGYGVRFGYTGHDLHGLIMGPDGKLYFSIGDRGTNVKTKDGRVVDLPDMGAVFRCNPDGTELEAVHTGLRNPQELAFDDHGNLFTGDNDCDQGDVERFVYVVEGGDSGWRVGYQHSPLKKAGPWNSEKLWVPHFEGQAAYIVPPIVNTADGPSGLTHYPGTGLPSTFRDHFFMCHFKGSFTNSGIFLYAVQPDGAFFKMVRQEPFITGILPTDVDFGPDSRLYFSDWGQGWAKSKRGRIYALTHSATVGDPLIKETQRLLAEGMSARSDAELTALLGHADQRVRREAQYALAAKGSAALPSLNPVAARNDNQLARIHALWAIGQIWRKKPGALDVVLPLLRDSDPEIRAQAAKILGDVKAAGAFKELVAALGDPSARVQFFAAMALGKLARREAAAPLLAMLRANADRDLYVRHAGVMGLVGSGNVDALIAAAGDASPAVRMGVLLAFRRLGRAEVARFLTDADPLLVVEAARAINDVPIVGAQQALGALLETAGATTPEPILLRALNAHFRSGRTEDARALAVYAARKDAPEAMRVEALTHLRSWAKPPARDRVVGIFRPLPARDTSLATRAIEPLVPSLLSDSSEAVLLSTLEMLDALRLSSAADAVFAFTIRTDAPASIRAAALKPLSVWNHPRFIETVKAAGLSEDPQLRAAAQEFYAKLSPAEALPILTHALESGTLLEKQSALINLATLPDARVDDLLADYLSRISQDPALAPLQVEIIEAAEKRGGPVLKGLLAQREASLAGAAPALKFAFALQGGTKAKGRKLFYDHPVLACIRCHKLRDQGGEAGPALDDVGLRQSREYVLESIVAPNAAIATGFDSVSLTLKDGSFQVGSIAAEDDTHLSLRPPTGDEPVKIAKADVVKRESAPSSMPEIYAAILSRAELRDLVEFVSSLRTKGMGN